MIVRDLMAKPTTTCQPKTDLAAASALMWEHDCRILPVLAETGKLVGILTDRDICIALGTRNTRAWELTAGDVAGANPLTCESTDDIRLALQIMRDAKTRYLAVVDGDGVLDGMVSIEDIILSVQRRDAKAGPAVTYSDLAMTLKAICNRTGDGAVSAHADGS